MILVMTDSVDFGLIYSENRRLSVFSSATITSVSTTSASVCVVCTSKTETGLLPLAAEEGF